MRLQFGDVTFDGAARQLYRRGAAAHLSPKAFDLLKLLIERRPTALSKAELHEYLWPATFVSEANLASLVAEIREALGDTARHSRYVRTAHRFGYAFCGGATDLTEALTADESFCWLIQEGRRLPLQPGENILGREPDGGVRIDSPTVSRHHARIVVGAEVMLEDLDSKNGTFLDGQRVTAAIRLKDGDEIRTGSVVFRFRMTTRTGSTATWSGQP